MSFLKFDLLLQRGTSLERTSENTVVEQERRNILLREQHKADRNRDSVC